MPYFVRGHVGSRVADVRSSPQTAEQQDAGQWRQSDKLRYRTDLRDAEQRVAGRDEAVKAPRRLHGEANIMWGASWVPSVRPEAVIAPRPPERPFAGNGKPAG